MTYTTFERSNHGNIRLHVLPTDRFKTFAICAYIGAPLTEQTVTPVALTPFVLRRGTRQYPETKQFREQLDEMYGAGFGFDVMKRGDYQIVTFRMDIIDERYVSGAAPQLAQGLRFLVEAMTSPALENGVFRSKYVEAEKDTVKKRIEAIVNDKIRYAAERCLEEMCKNEPYRLLALGAIKDLTPLTAEALYQQYVQWLQQSPIDLYIVGNTTLAQVEQILGNSFNSRENVADYQIPAPQPQVERVHTVVEQLEVNQGKLNMGLRVPVTYGDPSYAAALMYNGILGGYPHSKLFTNVREKASLAYYASSRLDGHKGILTVQSGIEMANYEQAVKIIREQLQAMEEGHITETELTQTRAMIANHLREIQDSAFEIISFDFNNVLSGKERTISELITAVALVDTPHIRDVAQKVQLDTIYFLRDRKEA